MFALGFCLALVTAAIVARSLRLASLPARLLAVYVLLVAQIVLVVEVLSLFRAVTLRAVLAAHTILLLIVLPLLLRRERPLPTRFSFRGELRGQRLITALLVVVSAALAYELALAVLTPPNNWDSMSYHLSRAAAWYSHHGVAYVDAHTQRENANPPNAEILVLFGFVLDKSDRFAAGWQWLAELAALIGVFGVARRLGYGIAPALLSSLVFAALAQTALQASTTQNDLLTASLVLACVALASGGDRHGLVLSAVALGLAIGTKLTAVFALPALAVVLAFALPRRQWRRFALLVAASVVVFGSFGYVLNVVHTGSLFGAHSATAAWRPRSWVDPPATVISIPLAMVLDFRGSPWWPANEDFSYFGPLGLLVVVPVVVWTLRRRRAGSASALEGALALALPLFVIALALGYRYNAWVGRFMLVPAALAAPLVAAAFRHRRYAASVVAVAIVTLVTTVLFNHAKPSGLGADPSIWTTTRVGAQARQRPAIRPFLRALQACVPARARLGYVLGEDDWDYPLYGRHLSRSLVRLPAQSALLEAERARLDWVVARRRLLGPLRPGWASLRFRGIGLVLLARRDAPCGNGVRSA